jgi:exopolysaccharide biosynthesis polyprenyl glycosylphosphotransferase
MGTKDTKEWVVVEKSPVFASIAAMQIVRRRERALLFFGDIICFSTALWLTLLVRYQSLPSFEIWQAHFVPFSLLFLLWIAVFFIAGLYDDHTLILKENLPRLLVSSQIVNAIVAVLFFYFASNFGINPKTNLVIYLLISVFLMYLWRRYGYRVFEPRKRRQAILIGSGPELHELEAEIKNNPRYPFTIIKTLDLEHEETATAARVVELIEQSGIRIVIMDFGHPRASALMEELYHFVFRGFQFIDFTEVYEQIFYRMPLSSLKHSWILEHVSPRTATFDVVRRGIDILVASVLGLLSLLLYPLIIVLIKLQDGGSIFYRQVRVGQHDRPVTMLKFRSMTGADSGTEVLKSKLAVTPIGRFLRKTRLDELPQLWNVFKGDLSLVGPRPEFPALAETYAKEIPYYNLRHVVKPGLSGWAQIYHEGHPHHGTDIEETKNKLSYDLYYIKNRSFFLDMQIYLKTIRTLFSRSGR